MIKNYSSYNFKSFKNEVKFDLSADKDINILPENIKKGLLKGLLFVGPNASGKTNSITILQALLEIVFGDIDISRYLNVFNNDDMWLSYTFSFIGKEIIYTIKYCVKNKFIEEKLSIDDKEIYFRSNTTVDAPITIEVQSKTTPILKDVLIWATETKVEELKEFYYFLNNSVIIDLYSSRTSQYNHKRLNPVIEYTDKILKNINKFLTNHSFEFTITKNISVAKIEELFFIKNNSSIKIPFDMESMGNKTLIYIFPIINSLLKQNGMLILDEFGSGMHNELEELLVRVFMTSKSNSQIFLVSHSTNLLTNTLLRPDQIYSVDYTEDGSFVEKFSKENPRNTQNLEKMYLGGVFGGLPNYTKE